MADNGWWSRHLGRAGAPEAPVTTPPAAPAPSFYPPKAVRWQESYPPTGPRQEVTNGQPEGNGDDNWHRVQRQGYVDKAPGSIGKSARCPGCGGGNYFSRRWANTECAPLCTDCGYNGDLFEQSGKMLNAIGMKSSGPTQFARSDNPDGSEHFEIDGSLAGHADFSWANVR